MSSLSYPRADDARWLHVLERAERDLLLPDGLQVRLFSDSDGVYMHGVDHAGKESRPMTPRQALAAPVATWCDCRGWMSTRLGELLCTLLDFYQAQDAERDGVVDTTWEAVWHRLRFVDERTSRWRREDQTLDQQREHTRSAQETIARRGATALDPRALHRCLAAQGIVVPVNHSQAIDLQRWATDQRIGDRRNPRDLAIYEPFEQALDTALADPHTVLVGIVGDPLRQSVLDTNVLPEIALLTWAQQLDTRTTTFLHLPRAVGEGLRVLQPWSTRTLVAGDDEHDPDILEIVRTLWEDRLRSDDPVRHLGRHGADEAISLDELLETARAL